LSTKKSLSALKPTGILEEQILAEKLLPLDGKWYWQECRIQATSAADFC